MRLEVGAGSAAEILLHAEEGYPEEACGVLLGRVGDGAHGVEHRSVLHLLPIPNERDEERERRYLIGPEAFRRAEEEAARRNLEVVGVYHSHPDHPAVPSQVDRDQAWPWYSYLIVSVLEGEAREVRSWRLAPDRSEFREEALRMDSGTSAHLRP